MLRAIHDHPADDAPRRVYADWLLERGDPRGELIHLQCELAMRSTSDPRRQAMRQREHELLRAHAVDWGPFRDPRIAWSFERGLLTGFGHEGVFHGAETTDDSDTWIRFFPDRTALYIVTATGGSADIVARWFVTGHQFSTALTYAFTSSDESRVVLDVQGNQPFTAVLTREWLDITLASSSARLLLEGTAADSRYSWPTT